MLLDTLDGSFMLADNTAKALRVGLWVMVAAILGIGGVLVAQRVRNWSRTDEKPSFFTLQDIREMRARGEISEQEFNDLRAAILGRAAEGLREPEPADKPEPLADDDSWVP